MIATRTSIFPVLLLVFLTSSCKYFRKEDPPKEKAIARYKDNYLYYSEVAELIKKAPNRDSANLVKNYVDAWIKKQLILDKAMSTLGDEEQDIEKQIKDYRESLLMYKYEDHLINEQLDTNVSEEAIRQYYEANTDNFLLKQDAVQFIYIALPRDAPKIDSARFLINSAKAADRKKLMAYCFQYAEDFSLADTLWVETSLIQRQIPIAAEQMESIARNKSTAEVEDSSYLYLLKVNNFKPRGELAPLDFVKEDIKRLIINKRKIDLINATYDKLLQQAVKKGNFEKY
ncbi:MAG: peptidylprolyl isomerase [Chitinophagales bacterium]|nr:peptidylprolyl isomerase [Chitinophagales bacterium]